jgi:hypothetical protein
MHRSLITIVIRAANERTFAACHSLLLQQVPADCVEVVNECPFERALQHTYKIGIQRAARWTMTLDADVLLREHIVKEFVAEAEAMPEHSLQIEGRVHDKLTGRYRQAGHRIYRTCHLERALREIPPIGTEIRPEYATLQRMEKLGFPSRQIALVVGVHDYEQYYRDIYRKGFVHANKHAWLLPELVARWKQLAPRDHDFRIALRALYDGLMTLDPVKIDADAHRRSAESVLQEIGLREKAELSADAISFDIVERSLLEAGPPPPFTSNKVGAPGSIWNKLWNHHRRLGTMRAIPFLAGIGFCKLGLFLKCAATAGRSNSDGPVA